MDRDEANTFDVINIFARTNDDSVAKVIIVVLLSMELYAIVSVDIRQNATGVALWQMTNGQCIE